jgi:hypothetical protein
MGDAIRCVFRNSLVGDKTMSLLLRIPFYFVLAVCVVLLESRAQAADVPLTVTIPDAYVSVMIAAFGETYPEMIEDPQNPGVMIPNPQSKAAYAKEQALLLIRMVLKARVDQYRYHQAQLAVDAEPWDAQ